VAQEMTMTHLRWIGYQGSPIDGLPFDGAERKRGSDASRPRVKFVDLADRLAVANMSVVWQLH
jgi:hypothetical protein